jgi:hypothetical protein
MLALRGGNNGANQVHSDGRVCSRHANEPVMSVRPDSHHQAQKFFTFEGLIGAGKSTLLAKLQDLGVTIIPEPLDR